MGADPSINWNDVSGGYDESVASMQSSVDEADANKTYWQNQNVLWASMYGNLESNIASYYDNLTAEGATSELNDKTTALITAAKEQALQQLQDRGFTNSGMVAQVIANSNTNEAIMLANNAYTANNEVWKQKVAFEQGIAMPQKQLNAQGIDSASARLSGAYGNLANVQNTRANAKMQVEQFNEAHSNDQINAGLGFAGTVAGAIAGGGIGAGGLTGAAGTSSYQFKAPQSSAATQFKAQQIKYDVVPTDTRIV